MKKLALKARGPVLLEVQADEKHYAFCAGTARRLRPLGRLPTRALSAENILAAIGRHHFTGACLGLYATGNGRRSGAPADFDWFEYRPR